MEFNGIHNELSLLSQDLTLRLPAASAIQERRDVLIEEVRKKLAEGAGKQIKDRTLRGGELALKQQLSRQQEQLEALRQQHLGEPKSRLSQREATQPL